MNKIIVSKAAHVAFIVLAVMGGLWILSKIFFQQVKYVAVCDANRLNCKTIQAQFSYDTGDGEFVIRKLYTAQNTVVTFSGTECWVAAGGSQCMDSSTNLNKTGNDRVIIPLAYQTTALRWGSQPKDQF